jgi:hypothetical protein
MDTAFPAEVEKRLAGRVVCAISRWTVSVLGGIADSAFENLARDSVEEPILCSATGTWVVSASDAKSFAASSCFTLSSTDDSNASALFLAASEGCGSFAKAPVVKPNPTSDGLEVSAKKSPRSIADGVSSFNSAASSVANKVEILALAATEGSVTADPPAVRKAKLPGTPDVGGPAATTVAWVVTVV